MELPISKSLRVTYTDDREDLILPAGMQEPYTLARVRDADDMRHTLYGKVVLPNSDDVLLLVRAASQNGRLTDFDSHGTVHLPITGKKLHDLFLEDEGVDQPYPKQLLNLALRIDTISKE